MELERKILDAIVGNVAESVTVIGRAVDGTSTTATIGATYEQRANLLGIVQSAIASVDGEAYAGALGVNVRFDRRVTAT